VVIQWSARRGGGAIVNHHNNQHAANENARLQNLWDGIETYAALMTDLNW
jgi:acetylornithine deacetylase/succinyl-diaminopimelate desuccinylase-like protein